MTEVMRDEDVRAEVAPVVAQAGKIAIVTAQDYSGAADFLKAVKAAQKRMVDHFAGMKAAAHAAWKAITAKEADMLKPLTDAEGVVKGRMVAWQTEQERIRQAEQRRLQAEADEKARREREALEARAAKLKTPEKAEALREQAAAIVAPVVTVATAAPVIKGQSIRKTWRAVVVDAAKVPREWLIVNDQALQAFARSTKGAVPVAGVEFKEEIGLASSSR